MKDRVEFSAEGGGEGKGNVSYIHTYPVVYLPISSILTLPFYISLPDPALNKT